MQWYCWIEGQQYGPVDLNDVRGWIEEGRLHPGDNVWSEGMAEWTAAGNIPELFPPAAGAAAPVQAGLPAPAGLPTPGELPAPGMPPLAQPKAGYPGKGLCITSLILGITSMPCMCCYGLGSILGLAGLILGIVGIRQAKRANAPYGMGTAGVIVSGIGLLLGLIIIVWIVVVIAQGGHGPAFKGFDFGPP